MPEPGFTVIDVETTGLFPEMHDRIVEIALVQTDRFGNPLSTWETLVNPARDLGPQHIHGIRGIDIADAPTFDEIVPEVIERVSGRAIVAHNAAFDARFLSAELRRSGYALAREPEYLCTMALARQYLPGAGRSLADCCDSYDIVTEGLHRASTDALAAAALLAAYIASSRGDRGFWDAALARGASSTWPPVAMHGGRGAKVRPAEATELTTANFLQRITDKMPDHDGPEETREYLALLDRALADRYIALHEAEALVQLAELLGISRDSIARLHSEYFQTLATVAWSDGVLTPSEQDDLIQVGRLLDIGDAILAAALEAPSGELASVDIEAFSVKPGDLIVLTGEMSRPRSAIEAELTSAGFVPWDAVTKKVAVLAAADPDSLSGKARKARDYGIPVVSEQGLYDLIARSA
jgi:DNA polymerase-3 subunit epsilon